MNAYLDYDISNPDDHTKVRKIADEYITSGLSISKIDQIINDKELEFSKRLAGFLAKSKIDVMATNSSVKVGFIIAMWGESRRLRPKSSNNPTGEDSIRTKLDQLDWLFSETKFDWSIFLVDDGDPENSAQVAEKMVESHRLKNKVNVSSLKDYIPADSWPLKGLSSVNDSHKGGAMLLGASQALAANCEAIVLSDCDNSVDLAQSGLLLKPFCDGSDVVLGDRKKESSLLVKQEARWGPGIVVLRHMQRMVGFELFSRGINDTQAAFKLYQKNAFEYIFHTPSTYGFSFDSDWLYASIEGHLTFESVPFTFIDSFEESASITQGPMSTWESLLKGLVASARGRNANYNKEMAEVIDKYGNQKNLEVIIEKVPEQLNGVPSDMLGDPEIMSPEELSNWISSITGK